MKMNQAAFSYMKFKAFLLILLLTTSSYASPVELFREKAFIGAVSVACLAGITCIYTYRYSVPEFSTIWYNALYYLGFKDELKRFAQSVFEQRFDRRKVYWEDCEQWLKQGADPNVHLKCNQDTPLTLACKWNNKAMLESLLKLPQTNINFLNLAKKHALQVACDNQNKELAELLLNAGVDLALQVGDGFSLGQYCLIRAYKHKNLNVVQLLLEKGVDSNVLIWSNHRDGYVSLFAYLIGLRIETDLTMIELLLQNKADPSIIIGKNIFYFISKERIKLLKLLLQYGACINEPDKDGCMPLDYALAKNQEEKDLLVPLLVSYGAKSRSESISEDQSLALQEKFIEEFVDVVSGKDYLDWDKCKRLLLAGADPNVSTVLLKEKRRKPAIVWSVNSFGIPWLAPILIYETRGQKRGNPLVWACSSGKPDVVKFLVSLQKTDVNFCDNSQTPLMAACTKRYLITMKVLLDAGADPNQFSCHKNHISSPLFNAVQTGNKDVVQLLLHYRANPSIMDPSSSATPLHDVLFLKSGNASTKNNLVSLLLNHGADVSLKDSYGKTPLDYDTEGIIKKIQKGEDEKTLLFERETFVKNISAERQVSCGGKKSRNVAHLLRHRALGK